MTAASPGTSGPGPAGVCATGRAGQKWVRLSSRPSPSLRRGARVAVDEGADVGDDLLDVFVPQWIGGVECEGFAVVKARVDAVEQQGVEVDVEA